MLTLGGFAFLGKSLKSGVIAWLWKNPLFVVSAAALVGRGNISLNINSVLSEIESEIGAVVEIE